MCYKNSFCRLYFKFGKEDLMSDKTKSRGQFTSSLGFILAAAGSAIGLGNIWKFPYVAGKNGGGVFLIFYVLFLLILGLPLIMSEMALGRKTSLNAIGTFEKINKKWKFVGFIGVVCSFIILSYYSVIGGWVTKYIFSYFTNANVAAPGYFDNFIANPVEPAVWHVLFMAFCCFVVCFGVAKGIEKASKIMLPILFILIIAVVIRSLLLPNSIKGLEFLFVPNFKEINSFPKFANVITSAMAQVFFSLSLGMGITITYGSYLNKNSNIQKDSVVILGLDTLIALLAGSAILPAVFSFGESPTEGPGLIFNTLPKIFDKMPLGNLFGALFFILIFFAAATSAIALLEVVTAVFIDNFGWSRTKAAVIMASLMAAIGVFASLSFSPVLSGIKIGGKNIFDALSFLTDNILMPLAGLLTCIFVGHIWGIDNASSEIECGSGKFRIRKIYSVIMKYIAPVLILIIFIMGFVSI